MGQPPKVAHTDELRATWWAARTAKLFLAQCAAPIANTLTLIERFEVSPTTAKAIAMKLHGLGILSDFELDHLFAANPEWRSA